MKYFIKFILDHKLKTALLVVYLSVLFINIEKLNLSFLSLYYCFLGIVSSEEVSGFILMFAEYWISSFFLLLTVMFLLLGIFKNNVWQKHAKSFFAKKTVEEIRRNRLFRCSFVTLWLIISAGFLAPFIAPHVPDEFSSVNITKYLPPFSSAKYIYYSELPFENNQPCYTANKANIASRLTEIKKDLNPAKQKIYFDSLKIDNFSLQIYQGNRIKTLPPFAINMKSAKINTDFFLLGTDSYGRDIFSRMIYGTRVSLGVALIATIISLLLGVALGLISGYFQKEFDTIIMRMTDIFLSFPVIFLLLLIVGLFGNSFFYIAVFIGLTTWMDVSRLTRAQVISIKNELFVLSAKAVGFSSFRTLYRHVLPNVVTPVIINGAFRLGNIIMMESALSFIGLGISEPTSSWGSIMNSGKDTLINAWWISLFPGLTITLAVILFNYIGDTFRRVVKIK